MYLPPRLYINTVLIRGQEYECDTAGRGKNIERNSLG